MIYIKNIAIFLLLLRVALQYSAGSCGRKPREPVSRNCSKSRLTSKTRQSTPTLLTQGEFNSELVFLTCLFLFYKFRVSDGLVLLSILDRHGVLSRLWKPKQPCLLCSLCILEAYWTYALQIHSPSLCLLSHSFCGSISKALWLRYLTYLQNSVNS